MKKRLSTHLPAVSPSLSSWIIVILSLCFVNSYDGDFVFDDAEAIVKNNDVRDTPLWEIFKNDFWGTKLSHNQSHKSYRPLTILSFRLHFWLRQDLISQDYHIVNIVLHSMVCLLTFLVYNVFLGPEGRNISFYATALFAVHPIHTEAVSGIVGRAELLCTLFIWLSVLSYNHAIYAKHLLRRWAAMFGCAVCVTIAMLCKETGITAIGICAMYDIVIVNRIYPIDVINSLLCKNSDKCFNNLVKYKVIILRLVALLLVAIMLLSLRLSIMGFSTPKFLPVDNPTSFMDNILLRTLNYNYIYCLNTWLLICPIWLCFDWSMGCVPLITGYDHRIFTIVIFWLMFGAIITYTFIPRKDKTSRYITMGLTILIIPFLPASNVFFNVGFVLAERILYIPSAGYCLLVVIGLQKFSTQFSLPKTSLLAYAMLIMLLFARSWVRSNQWRNEKLLFQSALDVCPLNAKVHYNIAKNAADAGNIILAKLEYQEALRLNPKYVQAMNNLGNLLKDNGQLPEAVNLFKQAITLQEDFATVWMNLGIVQSTLKQYEESEASYFTALQHQPVYPACYYNLGVLYLERKQYDKALKAWVKAAKQKPTHKQVWTNMILLLDDLNMTEKALKTANEALKFIPNHASVYFNIANILGKKGRFEEAEIQFKLAMSKNPTDPMIYANLGVLYHRWNKLNAAEEMYKKALQLKTDLQSARENLQRLYSLKASIK
ncbi:transmembrane and TPR repeat-containing protein 4 isoform X1 [Harpegnathos saltator]|uniref:dolichyl-phosphate-mannose--protein mannosyltransferase n=2 Tax=Harpegnathos saltator TaxID=610380 RepID=E2CA07_HARSA|nr:transmembrane and TPR repeat-containing protein 4 isoform X1 [Harpegnathos saltator]EFN75244.1 Transmembrane and TPR repeat-containing protein 4 [Harpegnathos saltator]